MKAWLIPIALSVSLLPACVIEWGDDGGDDGDDGCYDVPEPAALPLRNPYTGQCELFGGGGGGCDDWPGDDGSGGYPYPLWGACYSECEQLSETSCVGAAGCVAAYVQACPQDANCLLDYTVFAGCWDAADLPVPELPCGSLDAEYCNSRSDCSPVYQNERGWIDDSIPWQFVACATEQGPTACLEDAECGPGYECNLTDYCLPHPDCNETGDGGACPPVCYGQCVPATSGCDLIDCAPGYHCEVTCRDEPGCREGPDGGCAPPICDVTCVPDGSTGPVGECTGETFCPTLPPACPQGTTPGIANGCWTGYCIPLAACGHDPGECHGDVACDSLPPACPAGTVPGIDGACWSGYCIPEAACEPEACEDLASEQACRVRTDCAPVYEGQDCTCRPGGGCECREHVYARCETGVSLPTDPGTPRG
jgi:hypothetical protein